VSVNIHIPLKNIFLDTMNKSVIYIKWFYMNVPHRVLIFIKNIGVFRISTISNEYVVKPTFDIVKNSLYIYYG
jgi:hypothetical protein